MAKVNEQQVFNEALCARVAMLRGSWTQSKMAKLLGIPIDRYKKYETRTPLPHYLIERFATLVGRDIAYVLTGEAQVELHFHQTVEKIRRTK